MDDSGFIKNFGGVLLSHIVSHAVPSALKILTSVFGMGTGVASSLSPPKNFKLVFWCFVFGIWFLVRLEMRNTKHNIRYTKYESNYEHTKTFNMEKKKYG